VDAFEAWCEELGVEDEHTWLMMQAAWNVAVVHAIRVATEAGTPEVARRLTELLTPAL
jgi:hypothetical protein